MRYMLLIGSDDKNAPPRPRAEMEALVQGHRRFSEELQTAGKMVAGERLRPEGDASRVRLKAGQRQVMDGPFGRVVASVLRIVRDVDAAEEIAQDAFAQARSPTIGCGSSSRAAIPRLRRWSS